MAAMTGNKMDFRRIAQEAIHLARQDDHPSVAQMIAEIYKLTVGDDRLTKIFIVGLTGTLTQEESLEFNSYLCIAKSRCRSQEPSSNGDQRPPRLLLLPAELRNTIYRFTLVDEDPICISREVISNLTPLLHTCRQIQEEASAVFYAENTFTTTASAPGSTTFETAAWLYSLNNTDASAIKQLRVKYLLPRTSLEHLKAAKGFWTRNNEFGTASMLGRIMSQQDKNAATFVASLDGTPLDLKGLAGADSTGFADGEIHGDTPTQLRSILTKSWEQAIRKRVDEHLRDGEAERGDCLSS